MSQTATSAQASTKYPHIPSIGRDFFFPTLAIIAAVFFPVDWIIWSFVVVGHAHFLMAYLYQFRGKKMNKLYLFSSLALAGAAWGYFLFVGSTLPIFLASGILFSVHFAIDEFTLHSETFLRESWFSVASFASLFSWLILVIAPPAFGFFALGLLGLSIVCLVLRLVLGGWRLSRAEFYLLMVGMLLAILAIGFNAPSKIVGVILLLHFANWYVGYGARLKSKPERARQYWIEVAVTLAICFAVFVPFKFFGAGLLFVLFAPAYYYAWAIAHIVLSFVSALPRKTA